MRYVATVKGSEGYRRALRRHVKDVEKMASKVLRQEARGLAVGYGSETTPPDRGGEKAVDGFKERIAGEVARVFPARENPRGVYRLMKERDPELAKAYWAAHKAGKTRQMAVLVRKAGMPEGGASAGVLRKYRKGRGARVITGADAGEGLVRRNVQGKLIKEQQGKVGVAKAGWHQAAKAIGGRVRRNFVSATGKRTTAEAFPAYVRKASRKFPGLGGAFVSKDRVRIWTNVNHAVDALPTRRRKGAEAAAQVNLRKAMAYALAGLNRKNFG